MSEQVAAMVSKVDQIKSLRLTADELINTAKTLQSSREISLCHTNLQRTKHWLGKVLGTLDSPNPYPKSSDPSSPVIEKQAEHTPSSYAFSTEGSDKNAEHISHVKELRGFIGQLSDRLENIALINIYGQQAFLACEEAKMWLGWELDRLRPQEPTIGSSGTYTPPLFPNATPSM